MPMPKQEPLDLIEMHRQSIDLLDERIVAIPANQRNSRSRLDDWLGV